MGRGAYALAGTTLTPPASTEDAILDAEVTATRPPWHLDASKLWEMKTERLQRGTERCSTSTPTAIDVRSDAADRRASPSPVHDPRACMTPSPGLQSSALGMFMRGSGSSWTYPVVNLIHILGVATLFGALLILDLRLLEAARLRAPLPAIATVAAPVAMAGLALAIAASGVCRVSPPMVSSTRRTRFSW